MPLLKRLDAGGDPAELAELAITMRVELARKRQAPAHSTPHHEGGSAP